MMQNTLADFVDKEIMPVRETSYEKYYRDAVVLKVVLGGSHLGYFETCKQFYDLDYSSFGPGKLHEPA